MCVRLWGVTVAHLTQGWGFEKTCIFEDFLMMMMVDQVLLVWMQVISSVF
jgi:hypothetical protein